MALEKEIKIKVNKTDADKSVKELNSEMSKTSKISSSITGKLDSLTGGAVSKFRGMTKSLKGVTGGFKLMGSAIAATGIGIFLIAITAVIKAFKASEEGQNKFAKLMGVIGSVTGNLLDLLSDFGELVIDVFENPLESIKKFGNFIKERIINSFEGLLNLIPNLGRAFDQLLKGNIGEASKIAIDSVGQIVTGVDSITESTDKAIKKTKEFIEELEREAKIASKIADQRASADKIERGLIVERANADKRIAELRSIASRSDLFSLKERRDALVEASKINEEITNKEIVSAKLRREAIIEENKLSKSNKDALKAEEEAKASVIRLETKRLNLQKRLGTELASLNNQQKAAYEAELKRQQKILEEEEKARVKKAEAEAKSESERQDSIAKIREEYVKRAQDLEDDTEALRIERRRERALQELEELQATEQQKAEVISFYNNQAFEEKKRLEKKELEKVKEKNDREVAIKEQTEKAKLSIAGNTLNLLGGLLEEGSALAKGVAVAQATISGYEGVQNAFTTASKNPITSTFPAFPFIQAGLAGAFSAAQIGKILSTDSSSSGGSSQAPSQNTGISAPSFNLVEGTTENQIATSIQDRNREPVRAFVVGRSVTSQQEMDRNIESNATI